ASTNTEAAQSQSSQLAQLGVCHFGRWERRESVCCHSKVSEAVRTEMNLRLASRCRMERGSPALQPTPETITLESRTAMGFTVFAQPSLHLAHFVDNFIHRNCSGRALIPH